MILLLLFAFLAGIVTVLSPCILPILPIILSSTIGGKEIGKARPLGVVTGFILSFTFFTLFLSTIVRIFHIPGDALRLFSVIVIALFGVSLLVPQFQLLMEQLFSKLAGFMPRANMQAEQPTGWHAFIPGLLIGLSLGLLWTPCVGPILASVISLAITGEVTFDAFIITLAYSLGTAIPMFAIMIGGQQTLKKVPWLLANTGKIQKAFGVIMIVTALGILTNVDRSFQTFILNTFPQYGSGLTKFEDVELVRKQLQQLHGGEVKKDDSGKPMFDLTQQKGYRASEIIPGGEWINSKPLTLKALQGKVVIIDFWTYSCINCQRTLPYLRKWYESYKDKGLVIIGVHAPEFEFEKNPNNVRKAVSDFKLMYPIVQDNDFATWSAYDNHYWPAKYIIDKDGYVRYSHFGEGEYDKTEGIIQELLKETGATGISDKINNPTYQTYGTTPESYLGYARIARTASNERINENQLSAYSAPKDIPVDNTAFIGNWIINKEYASAQKGSKLLLNFESKDVYLVMRPKSHTPAKIKIYLDGKMQYFGDDNKNGTVTVDSDRLYKLIQLPTPGRHLLQLEFQDNNAELYAFTFG